MLVLFCSQLFTYVFYFVFSVFDLSYHTYAILQRITSGNKVSSRRKRKTVSDDLPFQHTYNLHTECLYCNRNG